VSRTSVREAIISLEMSGLVEVRVGTGIFVLAARESAPRAGVDAGPGPFELLNARKLVEGEIAAAAARSAKPADVEALQQSVERMARHVGDFALREAEDESFHRLLAKCTGNGSLELVVEGLWNQRAELWGRLQQHFHTSDLADKTIRDHAAIVAAVAAKDPDAARAALHRHLSRVAREFQRGVDTEQRGSEPPPVLPRAPARPLRDPAAKAGVAPRKSPANPRRS
jgi:DNA-binding FadR family transcriptional regulator